MYVLQAVPDFASFPVHIVLEELGVPYRLNLLDFEAEEHLQPEHLAFHPFGKIPALQTPDGPIFETAAILLWLADRHGRLAPAPDAPDRAAFLSWLFFASHSLHTGMMDLVHAARPAGEDCAHAVSASAQARLTSQLTVLDTLVATSNPSWLSPDQPSILGYYLSVLLRWMKAFPSFAEYAIDTSRFPALLAILRAMENQPAAIRAAAKEGMSGNFFSDPKA
jgi:glutathione S-transferase